VAHIQPEKDNSVVTIVLSWPYKFHSEQTSASGFRAETEFKEFIKIDIEDNLPASAEENYQF